MSRLRLLRVRFTGSVDPVSLDFGDALTIIYGASETGKSFLVSALDFMLGAKRLRPIPQLGQFSHIELAIAVDEQPYTLRRAVSGGQITLVPGYMDRNEEPAASRRLSISGQDSISRWLLEGVKIGLSDRRVLRNSRGDTQSLSFRNLAALSVVDETKIQSEVPPALSGQYVSATAEKSVFRIMLEDSDDSDVRLDVPSEAEVRANRARHQALEELAASVVRDLDGAPAQVDLIAQRSRADQEILRLTSSTRAPRERRSALLPVLRRQQVALQEVEQELAERTALVGRFELLSEQYRSDQQRLDLVLEAGNLLGYLTPAAVCPFCGAEPGAQNVSTHLREESTELAEAVRVEQSRVGRLQENLLTVLVTLRSALPDVELRVAQARAVVESAETALRIVEDELEVEEGSLREVLEARERAGEFLAMYAHLDRLLELQRNVGPTAEDDTEWVRHLSPVAARGLESRMRSMLMAWGVEEAPRLTFDADSADVLLDGIPRSERGKGMRSLLHACFTLSLSDYCLDNNRPHPGFVILDSPLVTYKEPEEGGEEHVDEPSDEYIDEGVANRFYNYIRSQCLAQVVIAENVAPPADLVDGKETRVHHFTKNVDYGTYGLLPVVTTST